MRWAPPDRFFGVQGGFPRSSAAGARRKKDEQARKSKREGANEIARSRKLSEEFWFSFLESIHKSVYTLATCHKCRDQTPLNLLAVVLTRSSSSLICARFSKLAEANCSASICSSSCRSLLIGGRRRVVCHFLCQHRLSIPGTLIASAHDIGITANLRNSIKREMRLQVCVEYRKHRRTFRAFQTGRTDLRGQNSHPRGGPQRPATPP